MLKVKPAKAFRFEGSSHTHYITVYDYASGKKNRYTTIAFRTSTEHIGYDAFVIGLELPLDHSIKIVKEYDAKFNFEKWCKELDWFCRNLQQTPAQKAKETIERKAKEKLTRACISCKAGVGKKCIGAYGRLRITPHVER